MEIVRTLIAPCLRDAVALERLLRLLLPGEDRERVYGMKTRRLMRVLSAALGKGGLPDVGVRLVRWVPVPCRSTLLGGPSGSKSVVCLPEVVMASAATQQQQQAAATTPSTVEAVCAACDTLTRLFLEREQGVGAAGGGMETGQVETLLQLMQGGGLDFGGWVLLARVLLKRVSVGVGLATVLQALPLTAAAPFYARQRSLRVLATAAVAAADSPSASAAAVRLVCGTPFSPMTGDALQMPYLLKWIFSREERLRHPISPIDGRLVILLRGSSKNASAAAAPTPSRGSEEEEQWFVPLNSANRTRMVNLEEDRVLQMVSRRRHLLLLREVSSSNSSSSNSSSNNTLTPFCVCMRVYSLSAPG